MSNNERPWIAVDLDGTLAIYTKFNGSEPGEPIPKMLERVKAWVEDGTKVQIFTARLSHPEADPKQTEIIQDWLERHGLPRLEVTCTKDYRVNEFWDDRAVSVESNTGRAFSWRHE